MTDSNVVPIKSDWGGTDTGQYDVDEFYTSARSPDGLSVSKSVPVPAHIGSQLAAMVQSGKFPYRTEADFWRDAAHHRLHHLDEMGMLDHETSRRVALWRRQEELERHEAEIEATERLVSDTRAMVAKARGIPDVVLLEKVGREAREAAGEMHEPWRGKLLAVVEGLGEDDG